MKENRNHVVITGVGRAGTTFLVKLLSHLNLPTGFNADKLDRHISKISNSGLENDIRSTKVKVPYIVKDPVMCDYIEEVVESEHIKLDHVYVPIRNLEDSAKSRVLVSKQNVLEGGMWKTGKPEDQACILAKLEFQLLVGLSKLDVPVTFIHFPKLIQDSKYLYNKMEFILKDIPYATFEEAFNRVADRSLSFSNKK